MVEDNKKTVIVMMTGPSLTRHPGGIQTHVQNFIDAFSTNSIIEFRFFPVTPGLYNKEGWLEKLRRFIWSIYPFVSNARLANVIHINTTFDNRSLLRDCVYLLIVKWLLKKPVVLQFHGGLPSRVSLTRSENLARLFTAILSSASKILILSRIQGDEFSCCFPGIQYDIVPNYIDCGSVECNVNSVSHSPMRFLFMGRLDESKGIKEIVAASRILAINDLKFVVDIYGDGPLRIWLENEVNIIQPDQHYLTYSGVVYGENKKAVLASGDIMLLPSSHAEGFPYAFLEASMYGMPLIATPVGAIPDVIVNGKNGLLIQNRDALELAEKMEYAVKNPASVRNMGVSARQLVETEFSIESLRIKFEEFYTTAAGAL